MSLVPPVPISPVFQDNVDLLIQDLLRDKTGTGLLNYQALLNRRKREEATIFEILEKIKVLGTGVGVTDGDKGDITVSGGGTVWTIDDGVITDSKIVDVDWSKITNVPVLSTPAGVTGNIQFNNAGAFGADSNLFWDNNNKRLGIGTITPTDYLSIEFDDNNFKKGIAIRNTNTGANALVGWGIMNSANVLTGQFVYCSPVYTTVPLRNTVLFSSAGQQRLGFVANAQGGGDAQDLYFTTRGSNTTYQLLIKGNTGNLLVNTNTDEPSAILNVTSTTKGFLPPRMTELQRNAIGSPATGLFLYQTNNTENLYVKKSTDWKRILTEDDGNNYLIGLGTANTIPFWLNSNTLSTSSNLYWDALNTRLGIGTPIPAVDVHIKYNRNASDRTFRIENTSSGGSAITGFDLYNNIGRMGGFTTYSSTFGVTSLRNNIVGAAINSFILAAAGETETGSTNTFVEFRPGGYLNSESRVRSYRDSFIISDSEITSLSESSAVLNVNSSSRGFLPPRMTELQRNAILSPATGLITYQTSAAENLYLKKSTAWKRILTEDDSITPSVGTSSNVLIDCGSFLAPNENILIDCGNFI